ncbi:MAG: hypothetical protein KAU50_01840 [Candidatus Marinimicrobia bacterium]|nr:hypothetical protein [Candidatus Neomarinimicrobiota bacterium]
MASDLQVGGVKSITDGFGIDVYGEGKQDSSGSWSVSIAEYPTSTLESRSHDYEIRFTESGAIAYSWGSPTVSTAAFMVDFEVWDVTEGVDQQVCFEVNDANSNQQWDEGESIFLITAPYPSPSIGDPIVAAFPDNFPYTLIIINAPTDTLGLPPQAGDMVQLESYRSIRDDDVFTFQLQLPFHDPDAGDLSEIRVVPNPYIVGARWEEIQNAHLIRFMFLPPVCTINIYTLGGEKIRTIPHDDYTGDAVWNVLNESNQALAFGVYVYVVTTPQGGKHIGRFALIK